MRLNNNYIVLKPNVKIDTFDLKAYGFITEAQKDYNIRWYDVKYSTLRKAYTSYYSDKKENAFTFCERVKRLFENNNSINIINAGITSKNGWRFQYVINFEIDFYKYTCYISASSKKIIASKEAMLYLLQCCKYDKKQSEYIYK